MHVTLADRFDVPLQIAAKQLKDETVILDLGNDVQFGLNAVGADIWGYLEVGSSLAEICDELSREYDADRPVIEADVLALAEELLGRGLIDVRR